VPYVDVEKDFREKKYGMLGDPDEKNGDSKDGLLGKEGERNLLIEELSVYQNTDALQVELGNIKPIVIASGLKYDTEKSDEHKDRYSGLNMMMGYINNELERENRRKAKEVNCGDAVMAITFGW